MEDSKLRRRLSRVNIPVLVVWGESDRLITLTMDVLMLNRSLIPALNSSQKLGISRILSNLYASSKLYSSSPTASLLRHQLQN